MKCFSQRMLFVTVVTSQLELIKQLDKSMAIVNFGVVKLAPIIPNMLSFDIPERFVSLAIEFISLSLLIEWVKMMWIVIVMIKTINLANSDNFQWGAHLKIDKGRTYDLLRDYEPDI